MARFFKWLESLFFYQPPPIDPRYGECIYCQCVRVTCDEANERCKHPNLRTKRRN